jgi:hypothetical protein
MTKAVTRLTVLTHFPRCGQPPVLGADIDFIIRTALGMGHDTLFGDYCQGPAADYNQSCVQQRKQSCVTVSTAKAVYSMIKD